MSEEASSLVSLRFDHLENRGPTGKTIRQYEKELSTQQECLAFCTGMQTGAQLVRQLMGQDLQSAG